MTLSPKANETLRAIGAGVLAAALLVFGGAAYGACSATPVQRAQAAKVEIDLCRLRLVASALEAINPELQPPVGSVRAQIEEAEDRLCAHLDDAGTGGAP